MESQRRMRQEEQLVIKITLQVTKTTNQRLKQTWDSKSKLFKIKTNVRLLLRLLKEQYANKILLRNNKRGLRAFLICRERGLLVVLKSRERITRFLMFRERWIRALRPEKFCAQKVAIRKVLGFWASGVSTSRFGICKSLNISLGSE